MSKTMKDLYDEVDAIFPRAQRHQVKDLIVDAFGVGQYTERAEQAAAAWSSYLADRVGSVTVTLDNPDGLYAEEPLAPWEKELRAAKDTPARATVLDDAKQAICQDRNTDYGEPIDNFGRWAGAVNALGYRGPGGRDLKPHDMAVIAAAGKLARTVESPGKQDHWVDVAGYAATGYECVTLEG